MTSIERPPCRDAEAQELSERLADVFRTADVGDVFTEDVFLDGHPPFWRFQLQGRDEFAAWLTGYAPHGTDVTVARTTPDGLRLRHRTDRQPRGRRRRDRPTARSSSVRSAMAASPRLTIYCSGDWDAELRARHAAETTLLRP